MKSISLLRACGGYYGINIAVSGCGQVGFLYESADGAFLRLMSRLGARRLGKSGCFEYVSVTVGYNVVLIFVGAYGTFMKRISVRRTGGRHDGFDVFVSRRFKNGRFYIAADGAFFRFRTVLCTGYGNVLYFLILVRTEIF